MTQQLAMFAFVKWWSIDHDWMKLVVVAGLSLLVGTLVEVFKNLATKRNRVVQVRRAIDEDIVSLWENMAITTSSVDGIFWTIAKMTHYEVVRRDNPDLFFQSGELWDVGVACEQIQQLIRLSKSAVCDYGEHFPPFTCKDLLPMMREALWDKKTLKSLETIEILDEVEKRRSRREQAKEKKLRRDEVMKLEQEAAAAEGITIEELRKRMDVDIPF